LSCIHLELIFAFPLHRDSPRLHNLSRLSARHTREFDEINDLAGAFTMPMVIEFFFVFPCEEIQHKNFTFSRSRLMQNGVDIIIAILGCLFGEKTVKRQRASRHTFGD
jgi:hypothetical protein